MSYQIYKKYKDSGVEIIGEIPEHWNIRKLRYFAKIQPSNVDKKSVENQETIHLCNYLDVYNHEYIDKNIDFMKATASDSQIKNFSLRKGDIIITKDSETPLDIAVPAYVPKSLPGIICGYHLAMIRPQNEIAVGEFLFRAFQSESISNQYSSFSNGLTRYGLKVYAIGDALFPLPPLEEQKSIINFLKKKTSEIDILIINKEKQIELLQEYRQIIISEAVTKGLDPKVKMENSEIKWIGIFPAHWKILRIKVVVNKIINGDWGDSPQNNENDIYCIRVADFDMDIFGIKNKDYTIRNIKTDKQIKRLLTKEDLLIERSGGGQKQPIGRLVRYNLTLKAVCSNFISKISLRNDYIHKDYFAFYMNNL